MNKYRIENRRLLPVASPALLCFAIDATYVGYDKERETVKYRCPARREGWACPSEVKCNAGKTYGLAVRLSCALDLRRFPS